MMRLRRFRLGYLFLALTACAHWEPQTRPIPDVLDSRPTQLLVTRHDRSTVILVDPVLTDSSLVGIYRTPRGKVQNDSTVRVPLADIASAATWDPGSPVVFKAVGFGVLGLLVGFTVVCFATGCSST